MKPKPARFGVKAVISCCDLTNNNIFMESIMHFNWCRSVSDIVLRGTISKSLLVVLCGSTLSQAQSTPGPSPIPSTVSRVLPPSPNAASIVRYGYIPVSLYTGLPNISIPVYNLDNGASHNVPITLSYHASGIKVDDIASWVGTGWSLDCGGVIARTMHGLPDEGPHGYMQQESNNGIRSQAGYIDSVDFGFAKNLEGRYRVLTQASEGTLDLEPDVYSYNFAGHSGQFVFDHQGQIAMIPHQPLAITYEPANGFKVVDEGGTTYVFSSKETTSTAPDGDDGRIVPYVSSWYLSKIEPAVGPVITFSYQACNIVYPANISETRTVTVANASFTPTANLRPGRSVYKATSMIRTDFALTLQRINTATTEVRFYSNTSSRVDVLRAAQLDSVVVSSTAGIRIKKLSFNYLSRMGNRLFLQEMAEQSPTSANLHLPPYQFRYYDQVLLPSLFSKQQDHWGYLNSIAAVSTLIPTTTVTCEASGAPPFDVIFPGADRSPKPSLMRAGTLTKIIYPTGGSTDFEYEPHDYGYEGGSALLVHVTTKAKRIGLVSRLSPQHNIVDYDSIQLKFTRSTELHFTGSTNEGTTKGSKTGNYGIAEAGYICRTCACCPNQYLIGAGNTASWDIKRVLEPGIYTFYTSYERTVGGASPGHASMTISYKDSIGASVNLEASGLRIKRITSKADGNSPSITKEYLYRMEGDTSRSSGSLVGLSPNYMYKHNVMSCGETVRDNALFCVLSSNGSGHVGMTQGALVGYREVTERIGRNGRNGKTIYKYTSPYEYTDGGTTDFPFAPVTSFDFKRGKLLRTTEYAYTKDGNFTPVRETVNQYAFLSKRTHRKPTEIVGLKIGRTFHLSQCATTDLFPDRFSIKRYRYISDWIYLAKSVVRQYSTEDFTKYSQTATVYHYGNGQHMQLTHQTQTLTDNTRLSKLYRYPLDVSATATPTDAPSIGIAAMVSHHMLTPVVEEQIWRCNGNDSVLVSASLTHYTDVQPKRIFRLVTPTPVTAGSVITTMTLSNGKFQQDSRYREKLVFDKYDINGNLSEQHGSLDMHTCYLWGYNNSLPIAELKLVNQQELQAALSSLGLTTVTLNFKTTDGTTSESNLCNIYARLRELLPKALITSFTYAPLVGMTSQTDPSGRTTTYEYDALGRLVRTRDEQGRVLSQQQYHYARP